MRLVAISSVTGGAGSTTVTAHLASALHQRHKPVLAIDCCPDNLLRLFFGMEWSDHRGFAADLITGGAWHKQAYRSATGIQFLPFGKLVNEQALNTFNHWLEQRPQWLAESLAQIQLAPQTIILCDCSRQHSALRNQVLAHADVILTVIATDALSYIHASAAAQQGYIVINGFDATRTLDKDIARILKAQYPQQLAPVIIHRDESVREAIACKQTTLEFAPASAATYDFNALATWLAAVVYK